MRTVVITRLEDLDILDAESAGRIASILSNRRTDGDSPSLTSTVLIWENGWQGGKPYLVVLEFSNAELFHRFGKLWYWEQRFLVRALLKTLEDPDRATISPVIDRCVEVDVPWGARKRRRISVHMTGLMSIGDDMEPRLAFGLKIGLI